MTRCAETSFSSMRTHLSDNNHTAVPSHIYILSLVFSSRFVFLFFQRKEKANEQHAV